ncbi:alpha-amylase [Klebsiella pneumoniae]|nr:alpha-amylase [Klebsiella pneumoniae]
MKNPTLLQCFHWYYPTGGELWPEVEALAPSLNEIGINMGLVATRLQRRLGRLLRRL